MQIQFIRGVADSHIRVKLLEMESETEFEQTVNLALALEAAKKENNEELDHNASDNVNHISYNKKNQNNRPRLNNSNNSSATNSVSYTHLTLPTIYSV